MSKKNKRNKKQKTVYVDDGSSIADMSSVGGKKKTQNTPRPHATLREQWQTYTDAVKLMFLPMLAVLGMLAIAFLLVYLIL